MPAFPDAGVPCNRPVAVLNVAQDGAFKMLNDKTLPSGSEAVGVNEYALPLTTEVGGVPDITGGKLAAVTVIENAGSNVVAFPSVTLIVTLVDVPTFPAAGVPCSRPVVVLNVAHKGIFPILNVSASPLASAAVGVNA